MLPIRVFPPRRRQQNQYRLAISSLITASTKSDPYWVISQVWLCIN